MQRWYRILGVAVKPFSFFPIAMFGFRLFATGAIANGAPSAPLAPLPLSPDAAPINGIPVRKSRSVTKKVWLTGGAGYTRIQGEAKSSHAINSFGAHGMTLVDMLRITPKTMLTAGFGLDYSYGGYSSSENSVDTDFTLSLLNGVGSVGVARIEPSFRISGDLQFYMSVLNSVDLKIKESSLFEVNNYSAQSELQKYNRLDFVLRGMGQIKPNFWVGAYAGYTLTGTLKAKSTPNESFGGYQVGVFVSRAINWTIINKDEEAPKYQMPRDIQEEYDPMKGFGD
jgi:hypothetical protein